MPLLLVFRNKLTTYFTNGKENREKKLKLFRNTYKKRKENVSVFLSFYSIKISYQKILYSFNCLACFIPSVCIEER